MATRVPVRVSHGLSDQDRHDIAVCAAWSVEDALAALDREGRQRTASRVSTVLSWALEALGGGVSA